MPFDVRTAGGPHSVSILSKYPLRGSASLMRFPSASVYGVQSTRLSDVAAQTHCSPQYMRYFILPPTDTFAATCLPFLTSVSIEPDLQAKSAYLPSNACRNAGPCFFHVLKSRDVAMESLGLSWFHDVYVIT